MRVRYNGPSAAVRVAGRRVERGGTVEVPARIGETLPAPAWEIVPDQPAAKKTAAKKAAAKNTTDEEG